MLRFTAKLTEKITLLVDSLQREKPDKNFTISKSNTYWCINWKTNKHLNESFQIEIWSINEKYFLIGEYKKENAIENLSEEYFEYEDMEITDLLLITDEIVEKTKNAILEVQNN